MADRGGVDVKFQGAIAACRATSNKYGYKGFYRGNLANLCKVSVAIYGALIILNLNLSSKLLT